MDLQLSQYPPKNREKTKTMEHVWRGSPNNLGPDADLFTGVLPNGYGPPGGFCFSWYCSDPPIMDDPSMHDYNVDERVNLFIAVCMLFTLCHSRVSLKEGCEVIFNNTSELTHVVMHEFHARGFWMRPRIPI